MWTVPGFEPGIQYTTLTTVLEPTALTGIGKMGTIPHLHLYAVFMFWFAFVYNGHINKFKL